MIGEYSFVLQWVALIVGTMIGEYSFVLQWVVLIVGTMSRE
jgi:hypothetical protein